MKQMKRGLVSLLMLAVLISTLPPPALAAPEDPGGETPAAETPEASEAPSEPDIIASGNCGAQGIGSNLTWTLDSNGTLTISGMGEMSDYDLTFSPWDDNRDTITKVVLETGITSIGGSAFAECRSLTSVIIPDSVTSIGNNVFNGCRSLTSVIIPDSVTTIGNAAFGGCSGLTSVTIPNSVIEIGDSAFSGCLGLTSVIIPDSVTSIEFDTFWACRGLTSVTIPDSVTEIGYNSFGACDSLSDVYYGGLIAQWNAITIEGDVGDNLINATIHCTDGDLNPGTPEDPDALGSALPEGVRYVPYYEKIEKAASTRLELSGGTLPGGLDLDPYSGVISGVPVAAGTWSFTVRETRENGESISVRFRLIIQDNTNAAVRRPNDYPITEPIGTPDRTDPNHFIKTSYAEEQMTIDGPFDDYIEGRFKDLYIDGVLLVRDRDYSAWEGSTVITVHSQTFQRFGTGTHTIAAEFIEAGTGAMKRSAQNYTLMLPDSSGGGRDSKPAVKPNAKKPAQPALPFTDVSPSDWFYEDLVWAYQEGLIFGVSADSFVPQQAISQATIVTVLARLAKIDLSKFSGADEEGIENGQQWTEAAIWAKRSGLLAEGGVFTGAETTTRDQMAIMLVNYLHSIARDTTPPAEPPVFADAAEMSREGNDAFQVLYNYGIFRGVGGMRMNPAGATTRAHFVALIHRVANTALA